MKERIRGFIQGVIVCSLLVGTVAFAQGYSDTIEVLLDYVNLTVNGNDVNVDTILYNGTTYAPIREVAEMLDKEVGWNEETQTVSIDDDWISKIDSTEVIGVWRSIDFVKNINEFDDNITRDDLSIKHLVFNNTDVILDMRNGDKKSYTWVDDSINLYGVTSSEFMIKEINGSTYMFLVFKDEEYFNGGKIPSYYVFKKDNNADSHEIVKNNNFRYLENALFLIDGELYNDKDSIVGLNSTGFYIDENNRLYTNINIAKKFLKAVLGDYSISADTNNYYSNINYNSVSYITSESENVYDGVHMVEHIERVTIKNGEYELQYLYNSTTQEYDKSCIFLNHEISYKDYVILGNNRRSYSVDDILSCLGLEDVYKVYYDDELKINIIELLK